MSSGFFIRSFTRVVELCTPLFLRKPTMLAWLQVVTAGLSHVRLLIADYRAKTSYRLQFDFSKIELEHLLNDRFDPVGRGILVETVAREFPGYRHNAAEDRPRFVRNASEGPAPRYLRNRQEFADLPAFRVVLPGNLTLSADLERAIRAEVDRLNYVLNPYTVEQ